MKWFLKLLLVKLAITLMLVLSGCRDSGYITPPTQTFNATLNSTSAEGDANFSHDGRYLIFTSDRANKRSIFLFDMQRRRSIALPGLNQLGSMQYEGDISADGRYLVYVSEQLGKTDIFFYDRQTNKSQNLTKNFLGEVRQPSISGNGRFIAFEGNRSGQWDIEIYDRGFGADLSLPSNLRVTPNAE